MGVANSSSNTGSDRGSSCTEKNTWPFLRPKRVPVTLFPREGLSDRPMDMVSQELHIIGGNGRWSRMALNMVTIFRGKYTLPIALPVDFSSFRLLFWRMLLFRFFMFSDDDDDDDDDEDDDDDDDDDAADDDEDRFSCGSGSVPFGAAVRISGLPVRISVGLILM